MRINKVHVKAIGVRPSQPGKITNFNSDIATTQKIPGAMPIHWSSGLAEEVAYFELEVVARRLTPESDSGRTFF